MVVSTRVAHNIYLKQVIVDVTVSSDKEEVSCQYFTDWDFNKGVPSAKELHQFQRDALVFMDEFSKLEMANAKTTTAVATVVSATPVVQESETKPKAGYKGKAKKETIEAEVVSQPPAAAPVAEAAPVVAPVAAPVVDTPVVVTPPAFAGDTYQYEIAQNGLLTVLIPPILGADWKPRHTARVKALLAELKGTNFSLNGVIIPEFAAALKSGLQEIASGL
jgi:hypothetical protein